MPRRHWRYEELGGHELPIRDQIYESFGQQGVALPTYAPVRYEPEDAAEPAPLPPRVDLGEPIGGALRGPKGYQRSDERIREDVCERLSDDPFIDASDVDVLVHVGEVTLSGSVTDREQRRRADRLAESVRGVVDVFNHVRVRPRSAKQQR